MKRWMLLAMVLVMVLPATAGAQDEASEALETANGLASKGKLAEAVPYYKKSLELDPTGHPLAYLNLAEVQKVRGNCREAVLMYQLYAGIRDTEEARKEADAGVKRCKGDGWPKLEVRTTTDLGAKVKINGFVAGTDGKFGPASLPPGDYLVQVEAIDHHPSSQSVRLDAEDAKLEVSLEKMTFKGKILVQTAVPGARIRIFEGPSDKTKQLYDMRSPMKEGVEVMEGRHFVEVTANGYDRWIRNVSVGRDDVAVVKVELSREKPPELQ